MEISKQQAQNFLLYKTGLNSDRDFLQIIQDLSCIQVDPINIVARSHELSIYNRNKNFNKPDLYNAIYKDHSLFEFWMQLYSIIPIEAYPYLFNIQEVPGDRQREITPYYGESYRAEHSKQLELVLDFIKKNGPTSSKEILHLPKGKAVHSWKGLDSQIALLEFLWNTGELQITHRKSNYKYYDLTEKILSKKVLSKKITRKQSYKYLLDTYFKYFGLVRTSRLSRSGRNRAAGLKEELKWQLDTKQITELKIEGGKYKYYIKTPELKVLQNLENNQHTGINILAPLDPLIIDRELMVDAFDFFYRWEGYTPLVKRVYGYYNMPILFNGKFVGQIDMAKQTGKLITKKLSLTQKSPEITKALKQELKLLEKFALKES